MIRMPYAQIIEKIIKSAGISEGDAENKIKEKMSQLSGLISKEGAAHIVANELGVKLIETGKLKVKDILPGMRNIETVGRVTQIYEIREFVTNGREGKVGSFLMSDDTGVIRIVLWGSLADELRSIKDGTIVRVVDSYVKENMNGRKELHLNNNSRIIINPDGERVEEYLKPESLKKKIKELKDTDNNVELLGTIVSVFSPTFFVPKNMRKADGSIPSPEDYSYLINFVLDDGTETIRSVCFREQAEKLAGKTREEMMRYREAQELFDPIKNELLGSMVKLSGRATRNAMFDRLEFMANSVDKNINAEEEIRKIEAEITKTKQEVIGQAS